MKEFESGPNIYIGFFLQTKQMFYRTASDYHAFLLYE